VTILLELRGLVVEFGEPPTRTPVLRGVDLVVERGEIMGIVGETGAGKSMTARALLGLVDARARVSMRSYIFDGQDVSAGNRIAALRGRRIGFVPQNPRASLNPVFSVGDQLTDALRRLRGISAREARAEAVQLITQVQIPDPARRLRAYPHELSGGMCQRVCIAIALAGRPDLIIADEPTTGLDVTTQAETLALLRDMIQSRNAAGILITHDIGVVAEVCDRISVMYAGRVVDQGTSVDLFDEPLHPYAARLLQIAVALEHGEPPQVIPGMVPGPGEQLVGCAFAPRCPRATDICNSLEPPLVERGSQTAPCHHPVPSPGQAGVAVADRELTA
jgi:oligopeptide/dipeptide ABC transporter ATP-binding protein